MIEGFKAFLTKSKFPPETHAKATPRRAASPATSLDHICELETGAERRLKPVETCWNVAIVKKCCESVMSLSCHFGWGWCLWYSCSKLCGDSCYPSGQIFRYVSPSAKTDPGNSLSNFLRLSCLKSSDVQLHTESYWHTELWIFSLSVFGSVVSTVSFVKILHESQAFPPARLTSTAGYLELELVPSLEATGSTACTWSQPVRTSMWTNMEKHIASWWFRWGYPKLVDGKSRKRMM